MGILNLTPDSFSNHGELFGGNGKIDVDAARQAALQMFADGAQIVDLGGESTRPGATAVSADEEKQRVIPVLEAIKRENPELAISVDTFKGEVAACALAAGADMINDVSGLQHSPEIAELAAQYDAKLVIMHMRGTPQTMQNAENLLYDDLIGEVSEFLHNAAAAAVKCGVKKENIYLDPGIGFSKTVEQNLQLIIHATDFARLGYKLLYGPSRKSFIGRILQLDDPEERVWGSGGVVAALHSMNVDVIRVHDVAPMAQMLRMYDLCRA